MKRLIVVIVATLIIVGLAVGESLISSTFLNEIIDITKEISLTSNEENFFYNENFEKIENLEERWEHHEKWLNMMTNLKNLEEIGEQITLLKASIATKNFNDFTNSLYLISYHASEYKTMFGIKFQNII